MYLLFYCYVQGRTVSIKFTFLSDFFLSYFLLHLIFKLRIIGGGEPKQHANTITRGKTNFSAVLLFTLCNVFLCFPSGSRGGSVFCEQPRQTALLELGKCGCKPCSSVQGGQYWVLLQSALKKTLGFELIILFRKYLN